MSIALLGRQKCCCGCYYFAAVVSSPAEGQVTFGDALGSLLTVESDSWDITGTGRLRVSGPGRIIIESPQPDGLPMHALSFTSEGVSYSAGARMVRLLIDYLDGSNYHYVEATPEDEPGGFPPSGKVASVVGGVDTVLSKGDIWFVDNSNFTASAAGNICMQNGVVHAAGPWPQLWFSSTIPYLVVSPTTPAGGLKAAVEVIQGPSDTMTFASLGVYRQSALDCPLPLNYCGACMTVPGCHTIPTGGFMVTLSGITSGAFPVGDNCTAAAQFNGSFTLDEFGVFNVGHRQPGIGFPGPGGGTFHTGRVRGWRSAAFDLTTAVSCNSLGSPVTFTHGRIVLEPLGYTGQATGGSPDLTSCKTGFRVHMIAGNTPASENYLHWRWLGVLGPVWPYADIPEGAPSGDGAIVSTGNEVMFDCETIDGATFSGGGQATPFDTTDASFTVDAL